MFNQARVAEPEYHLTGRVAASKGYNMSSRADCMAPAIPAKQKLEEPRGLVMFCTQCGARLPERAAFCAQCGVRVAAPPAGGASIPSPASAPHPVGPPPEAPFTPPAAGQGFTRPTPADLASLWQRFGSWIIDMVVGAIPLVNWAVVIGNLIAYRRGMTLGLTIVGARIVRGNGQISGFYHTAVRGMAAVLSFIPLGLGYWWAFWDPYKQTWHDKIMDTYVVRNTEEMSRRPGTSARAAVIIFWILLAASIIIAFLVAMAIAAAAAWGEFL